jgi:hypothetical protein
MVGAWVATHAITQIVFVVIVEEKIFSIMCRGEGLHDVAVRTMPFK